jgi:predicted DNA-binding transcriptional regulator YafY
MAETALDRIERILQILPLAGREGGIAYDDLARALGVDRKQIERDITEVTDMEFYLEAGAVADIVVGLESNRVRVSTTGHLHRPARLSPAEAAALDLGVRLLAAEQEDPALAHAMADIIDQVARAIPRELLERVAADGDPDAGDPVRALVVDAARRRRRLRMRYLKLDAETPEDREVEPWAVVYGEGCWYVVGRCLERDGVRAFRIDRILDAVVTPADFEPPADFDPAGYLAKGRVYRADEEVEAVVRYDARVAPYVREGGEGEGGGEPQEDGSVVVRYRVADPGWLVRHVLQYGRHARVLEPDDFAHLVQEAARRVERAATA